MDPIWNKIIEIQVMVTQCHENQWFFPCGASKRNLVWF